MCHEHGELLSVMIFLLEFSGVKMLIMMLKRRPSGCAHVAQTLI